MQKNDQIQIKEKKVGPIMAYYWYQLESSLLIVQNK